ncbi:MAG: hypothetical protein ACK4S6_04075 [Roseateles asaccharophilus]|uniref:TonB-dependent receptor-like protein n=1 Tax=Roseateles asaccharophilus TaxID=582607 RepID=A0A4R6NCJ6_9BURK|nr:hypothetical protein [Roseateles asaccharophilus]MDN3543042.1 hypothetical protein [Roseateles asaccharophilus]TDP13260.1 hypothetical protein DFR39_101735 [Roseateles asaccharophilus]
MNRKQALVQVLFTLAAGLMFAGAASAQKIEQLPRVVITGKSVPASQAQQVVQLPRVVIEGRSLGSAGNTQLAAAKPQRRV